MRICKQLTTRAAHCGFAVLVIAVLVTGSTGAFQLHLRSARYPPYAPSKTKGVYRREVDVISGTDRGARLLLTMKGTTLLLARLEIGLSNRDVVELFRYHGSHLQSVHEIERRFSRIYKNGNIDFRSPSIASSLIYTMPTRGQEPNLIGQQRPSSPKSKTPPRRLLISISDLIQRAVKSHARRVDISTLIQPAS